MFRDVLTQVQRFSIPALRCLSWRQSPDVGCIGRQCLKRKQAATITYDIYGYYLSFCFCVSVYVRAFSPRDWCVPRAGLEPARPFRARRF